ncbi:MAG: 23S rRNA (pseudouridine(1915)-N(3))-methyltransferase RlmH [Alphaproteobacteria bacterium]|jgi:23S rRNA (pseudouridine1915-N3)-methyltransferase|nr:23S rRNA (pseudouridine(1915)-N(3))-methyltransferase RlmH [Alphaproteobacteria bacterium]
MKMKIISIGKIKAKSPEAEIINEYKKRLKNNSLKIIELEVKNFSNPLDKKQKEAQLIEKHISDNDILICMDEHGENLTSIQFSDIIKKHQDQGKEIALVIGGAFGIHEYLLNKARYKIAFGKCTFPHKLLRAMLVEQIYRAISIINNHPYHKE